MERILHPFLALLASATRQELARQVTYLKEENRLLRARLPKRIVATEREKRRLLRAGRKLGPQLKELMSLVSYQTFAKWAREHDLAPGPARGKGSWDEFLRIHAHTLWQCDFVSKRMWTLRGIVDLYFLVFLHLGTR